MKKYLLDLYNSCKNLFVAALEGEVKIAKNIIPFSPCITIDHSDGSTESITEIEYNAEEKCCYVHNFITDDNMDTSEYWTPLRDLSFDELFKIAERL